MKRMPLQLRPIHHCTNDLVLAPVFSCMLDYYVEYVEYQLRQTLAPMSFAFAVENYA